MRQPLETKAKKRLSIIVGILVLISLIAVLYPFITNPTSITKAYETAGVFAPVMFILLVMVAPTPGAIVGASGGAYFGIWHGAVYLLIGNLLGVCLTFWLVQRFGRPAAQRFFKKEKLAQYESFIARHKYLPWFVYAIPVFPLELMTFVFALSKKPFKEFFITVATALPFYALFVTTVGYFVSDRFQQAFEYASMAVLIVMIYAIVHFLYAWKKEEIHKAGRTVRRHVKQGVEDFTDATEKITRSAVKNIKTASRKMRKK